jgi:hypothetical protein
VTRSVAELLPRRFEELTLEDVGAILAAHVEERETLWLERKAQVSPNSLAKSCAAFANTYGGLLVVGVGNEDSTLVGIEPVAVEAQLWVKDTLRTLVLPMPAFRARWLETADGRGLLIVLVEESSTTPHLLTRSGAIYVRNPGSSDPVPINDQRRLLDLTARGEDAARGAESRALKMLPKQLDHSGPHIRVISALAVAATGTGAGFSERLFAAETPEAIGEAVWGPSIGDAAGGREWRREQWKQHEVGIVRLLHRDFSFGEGDIVEGAIVSRDGAAVVYRTRTLREHRDDDAQALIESHLRKEQSDALNGLRNVLLDLGAHGDLRFMYQLQSHGANFHFDGRPQQPWANRLPPVFDVAFWTDFDEDVSDRLFDEIARAAGIGPTAGESM